MGQHEYRIFYRPASAADLKKRKLKHVPKTGDDFVPHECLKGASASEGTESYLPHSVNVELRFAGATTLDGPPSGPVDVRVALKNTDENCHKFGAIMEVPTLEDVDAALADHRFKETPATGPADLPAWSKAVRKEWRTLRTSLPANVWVRVFEQRTDVLRAAMLGPEGTPYHDNIFVFDFSFPPGYPNEPPASSYHSRGERVNPNLYENGKVCLSLLSTWSGKGSEMWDPKRSNMLQVLVSIQGLVLVDDPYYNEAGYEKQSGTAEGKRNGDQYNEQAFLASARSMISTVRDPPRHFEPLIRAHFHARAPKILRVCRAYLDEGCPIGQYDARLVSENVSADAGGSGTTGKADAAAEPPSRSASQSSGSEKKAPSRPPPTEGFKLTLRKLVPKLEAAFKANDELVDASERGERART